MENSHAFRVRASTAGYVIAMLFAGFTLAPVHANEPADEGGAQCGNGILEPGETCASCPADCAVRACDAPKQQRPVTIRFTAPPDHEILGVTLLLSYRSDRLSLPGHGAEQSVRDRLSDTLDQAIVAVNDLDYGMRVVLSRSRPIASGKLFAVRFDACGSAAAPSGADVACMVEACATVFGPAPGCSCTAKVQ